VAAGAAVLVWLAYPTVRQAPLNVDEELTLRLGDFSFAHIWHIVSTKRGGGPVHFWLEHFLLQWWPGLPSLRVPSLVFLCLALPAVALLARRLLDDEPAAAVVLLTALSPIPVLYSTFGRPHTLLFAWLMWSTVLALRAAEEHDRSLWIVAGALLGLSVFVHPTAPLYAITAFAASILYVPGSLRRHVRDAWPGAVALLVTFVPYYVKTLHVLNDRYGVGGRGGQSGRTFSGRPVWQDALGFLAPGEHGVNYFSVLAAAGVVALAVARRYRLLAFCAATIGMPVLFFSVVPTNGDSALFFDRYMIPATPAFLILVAAGVFALASWAGPLRLLVAVLLVAGLVGIEVRSDLDHRRATSGIGIDAIVAAVSHEPPGTIVFGSTGTSGANFSAFDYGHPANILDHLLALRVPSLRYVDDDSCERVPATLHGYGLWVFYAASPEEAAAAAKALHARAIGGRYFAVRSRTQLGRDALVREGLRLREAWKRAVPLNQRVDELLLSDRQILAGTCVPYGELGDPDISPHWPPVKTTHQ
jgi:Dolichyl-phosphate-mannose-protein mannosyltransferase